MQLSTSIVGVVVFTLATTSGILASIPKTATSFLPFLPSQVHFIPNSQNVLLHANQHLRLVTDGGARLSLIDGPETEPTNELIVNPHDDAIILAPTLNRSAYRSSDGGNTWARIHLPIDTQALGRTRFHSDSKQAILSGRLCSNRSQPECFNRKSYHTKDITAESPDWTPLPDNLTECVFAGSSPFFRPAVTISKDDIFCRKGIPNNQTYSDGFPVRNTIGVLVHLQPPFSSENVHEISFDGVKGLDLQALLLPSGKSGKHIVAYFFETHASRSSTTRFFETNDGVDWKPIIIPTPRKDRPQNLGTLVVFDTALGISDRGGASICRSNSDGYACQNVLSDLGYQMDIERVDGLDGVWITLDQGLRPVRGTTNEFVRLDSGRTLLSIDDGATWKPISYPEVCHGREDCSLNIHLETGWAIRRQRYDSPFSQSIAPGYMIGVGCPGDGLCDYDSSATYLSRDSGITWEMINPGPMLHAMGHNGDIIVLAYDSDFVDHVLFSLDGGHEWSKLALHLEFPIKPKTLLSSSKSLSKTFLLFGSLRSVDKNIAGRADHVLISIDFSNVMDKLCEPTDYEHWRVKNQDGAECVMGRKVSYVRRKVGAVCWSDKNMSKEAIIDEYCTCSDVDFECDLGFVLNNGTCTPTTSTADSSINCPQNASKSFSTSSGYRKIAGNACQGGIDKAMSIERECDSEDIRAPPHVVPLPMEQVILQEPHVLVG